LAIITDTHIIGWATHNTHTHTYTQGLSHTHIDTHTHTIVIGHCTHTWIHNIGHWLPLHILLHIGWHTLATHIIATYYCHTLLATDTHCFHIKSLKNIILATGVFNILHATLHTLILHWVDTHYCNTYCWIVITHTHIFTHYNSWPHIHWLHIVHTHIANNIGLATLHTPYTLVANNIVHITHISWPHTIHIGHMAIIRSIHIIINTIRPFGLLLAVITHNNIGHTYTAAIQGHTHYTLYEYCYYTYNIINSQIYINIHIEYYTLLPHIILVALYSLMAQLPAIILAIIHIHYRILAIVTLLPIHYHIITL